MKQTAYPPVSELPGKRHAEVVQEIFDTVPEAYDLLNRVLSLRRDVAWRRFAVERMRFFQTRRLLDLATGTADLALAALRRHGDIEVVGLDFARQMLMRGLEKTRRAVRKRRWGGLRESGPGAGRGGEGGCLAERDRPGRPGPDMMAVGEETSLGRIRGPGRIDLVQGDVRELPFRGADFDVAAIAFGIRNVPVADRQGVLKEMIRCVVPGGQVMILEMHLPESPYMGPLYRLYLNRLLPRIAGLFSANPAAYRYLVDSISNFPGPAAFGSLMAAAGLRDIVQYPLTLGATYLHVGNRPESSGSGL
ncbi:MAG: class I SAM-dependent methyltransferase [Pseudomonadota bacterium]|nr:class I SAM-dependent methyltransferase [Pseudomonadota bacterium]